LRGLRRGARELSGWRECRNANPTAAAFALANKMARGIWAMLTRGEDNRGPATASAA
jgi:transposase